ATKARIERNMSATLKMKDKQRKATLVNTSTEFNYHKVAKQLQLTRNEVARLTAEFEANLKKKEDEEFRLKKELADLSISLNMETQKKRTMVVEDHKYKKDTTQRDIQEERRRYGNLEDKLKQQSGQGVKHEYTKRRLSRDLINTKDSLSLKGREEIVSKLEESEHALYNRVRAAEMQRRKQEQIVTRLSTDFDMLRRDNARKIKVKTPLANQNKALVQLTNQNKALTKLTNQNIDKANQSKQGIDTTIQSESDTDSTNQSE
ncbi:predicted protein, partial [Nematostella vectensis]